MDEFCHDESPDEEEWLGGLRRVGLPVRTDSTVPLASAALVELLDDERFDDRVSPGLRHLLEAAVAPATGEKYRQGWLDFVGWCRGVGITRPIDATPLQVAEYLTHLVHSRLAWSTIEGRMAAIAAQFRDMGRPNPTTAYGVQRAKRGARRVLGTAQRRARALPIDLMRRLLVGLPIVDADRPSMRRDQLLIAVGWAAALRASELVALDAEDLSFHGAPDEGGGMLVTIRRSKSDQTATGTVVAVPWATRWATCPARLAHAYVREHRSGPLFRSIDRHGRTGRRLSTDAVSDIIRRAMREILVDDPDVDLEHADLDGFSGHSLRAGFATSAEDAGVDPALIARHLRHAGDARGKDLRRIYDRPTSAFARTPFDESWW